MNNQSYSVSGREEITKAAAKRWLVANNEKLIATKQYNAFDELTWTPPHRILRGATSFFMHILGNHSNTASEIRIDRDHSAYMEGGDLVLVWKYPDGQLINTTVYSVIVGE